MRTCLWASAFVTLGCIASLGVRLDSVTAADSSKAEVKGLQPASEPTPGLASAWSQLESFCHPPPEYAGSLGPYRPVLNFDDGRPVRTVSDWRRRREEIRRYWFALLGPWPRLIEQPRLERLSEIERDNFTQFRVRVDISPWQTAVGYLLVPHGKGPFPAVFVPYYDPETSVGLSQTPQRDFAYQLACRGFVTLSLGSPGGDARRPALGQAECQPLFYLAYVAANAANALGELPMVDRERIGIVGHSYGGKWAMFAACFYEKYACGAWSDPGIVFDESRPNVNYWEPWYLGRDKAVIRQPGVPAADNPRTGPYRQLIADGHDLHELLALMPPRPFLVSGGSEDPPLRWQALNHIVAVNSLLGCSNRVVLTQRSGHPPTPESNEQIYVFLEHFLYPATMR